MQILVFPLIAFTPGIFWLWFFARKNVYRPGPRRLLAITFFLGMVSTIPAAIIEGVFLDDSSMSSMTSLASVASAMLFVVGPVEELAKFAAVRFVAYRTLYFDEPSDGLVYGAAASLGFASLENLFYVMTFGPGVMLLRAPLSTLAHVVMSSFWARALGLGTQNETGGKVLVVSGLIFAAVAHGLFNVAVFSFPLASVAMLIVGMVWTLRQFNWAQRVSPFRYRRNYPGVRCPLCLRQISIMSQYCRFCGSPVAPPFGSIICSFCSNENRPDASYCTRCGDQLLSH